MMQRLTRQLFIADVLACVIVITALKIILTGISASVPNTVNNQYFFVIGLVATSIGFSLSKAQRNGIQASAGIAALGILLVWIIGARLPQPLFDLVSAIFNTLKQVIPAIQHDTAVETTAIQSAWAVIASASVTLWSRLQTWLAGFTSKTVNDALMRSLAWVLLYWVISAWLGWYTNKRNAVIAFLPALFLLTALTAYSEKKVDSLLALLASLLLLMGIWHYKSHMALWMKRRLDFSESLPLDVGQAIIAITVAVVLLAALTPSLSWDDLVNLIRRNNTDSVAKMLGVRPPATSNGSGTTQPPSMPREHLLTGGFANSEKVVMTIRTGELPPLSVETLPMPVPRYYWRSQVYDQYLGSGWGSSVILKQKVSANTPLLPAFLNNYRPIHLDVQMTEPEGKLFWSGILFRTDVPFTAQWRLRPTSDLFANQTVLMQSDIFIATSKATTYRAEVYLPTPTISQLHSATTDYPEEIRERYLELPSELPKRVRDLALDITAGVSNPYEKAKAIESYLRSNYPYDLNVPAPPTDQDATDYFLFELKRGYCDYYATAMVVLARANGLPARFVSGYSPGSYDASNAQYIIRELNAHSWAEVYFPGIGWVEFEPTSSLPEIERSESSTTQSEEALLQNIAPQEPKTKPLAVSWVEKKLIWVSPFAGILAIALIYFMFIERWFYLRLEPVTGIHRIYQNFYRIGKIFTGQISQAETSSEFLANVIRTLEDIESIKNNTKRLNQTKKNAEALTSIYNRSLFTNYRAKKADLVLAWNLWTSLRRHLFVIKIFLLLNSKRSS